MSAAELRGIPAAGGVAVGRAVVLFEPEAEAGGAGGERARADALAALDAVAAELDERADALRREGLAAEAEILAANALMASDPVLREEVAALALDVPAAIALRRAADRHAALLAALPDPLLAARAADVSELGRRAARRLAEPTPPLQADGPAIVVARDLGPAEVAELRDARALHVRGLALASGSATSHAAIMARSLGLPMAVGLGDGLLAVEDRGTLVLDGDRGRLYVEPDEATEAWGRSTMAWEEDLRRTLAAGRSLPAVTRDGEAVALLCNAGTAAEVKAGLAAGAEGVGLLRTELAFLEANAWPGEEEHVQALAPVLEPLRGRLATVRTLDFGADKTPPFLEGTPTRGISLLLEHPDALAAQLRAILRAGQAVRLRVLLPLVESREQLREVRALLHDAAAAVGVAVPPLGAMIETPLAAARARELAAEADFLSIGTNDLVQYTLGLDREAPLATVRTAADPAVLRHVASAGVAAAAVGVALEVCGEAAGIPPLAALFVGLGVGELSTAPARLDEIRAAVRGLSAAQARSAARAALDDPDAAAVLARAEVLLSELGDEIREAVGRRGGVVA
ncbi:MAG: phosphoenolpyruvate--protein phosphotransferase [Actinobacteria bacterium]|nr:MAG: phosphoenolpyruvate--protein phosphotransferase [Actinomycetota bacterium]